MREKVGNNQNGAVLLLDMNQRQIYISTSGNMIDYLTDRRIDTILDALETEMGDENYFEAAKTYLEKTETFVAEGVPGGHYRVDEETGKITRYKVITPLEIGIAVAAALVASIAFFLVTKSTYQLKRGGYTYAYHENADVQLTKKKIGWFTPLLQLAEFRKTTIPAVDLAAAAPPTPAAAERLAAVAEDFKKIKKAGYNHVVTSKS